MTHELLVLLVEDNPDDAALTLRGLAKTCAADRVIHVEDGAQAIELLLHTAAGDLPRLALLDLKLPKVDGLEVLSRLRSDAHTASVPVVIFSSSNEERDVAKSYQLGANSYATKPVNFDEYMAAVAAIGRYWCELNRKPR